MNLEDNLEDDDYKTSLINFLFEKYGDKLLNDDMLYKMNLKGVKRKMGFKNRTFYQELYVPLRLKSISKTQKGEKLEEIFDKEVRKIYIKS